MAVDQLIPMGTICSVTHFLQYLAYINKQAGAVHTAACEAQQTEARFEIEI